MEQPNPASDPDWIHAVPIERNFRQITLNAKGNGDAATFPCEIALRQEKVNNGRDFQIGTGFAPNSE